MKEEAVFLSDFPKQSEYDLTLFFFPSPGINWDSPGSLARTTVRNRLLKLPRGIGHVSVLIRGPKKNILTGMTQKFINEGRSEVLWQGFGFGILFHNFAGELERGEDLGPEIKSRSLKGNLSFLRADLSPAVGECLFQFVEDYKSRGGDRWYGMNNRPRFLEGGGCGPFAASLLEVAGLMTDEMKRAWSRAVRIPPELVGGPKHGRRVSALKMMMAARWAQESEPHELGFFWDPDLMHQWTMKQANLTSWNRASGITLDAKNAPVPSGPLFFV